MLNLIIQIKMKTKEEMIKRFIELYDVIKTTKDVAKMIIFGDVAKWIFKCMAGIHPDMAESWLSHIEEIEWNNYLSKKESDNISTKIINQNGAIGFHWSCEQFKEALKNHDKACEDKPYYNYYSLLTVTNMIYSDHAMSIALDMGYKTVQEAPDDKLLISCYHKALENLKDIDNKHFVRKYFKDKMYNDVIK